MKNYLKNFFSRSENVIFFILISTAAFLRLYRFNDFITFLGDQGRDAIILRRIITFEHFPAIGAPSSVGQVFLGPFYYYFIAPWLLIFNFNPIGPALGVAFFSLLFLVLLYWIVKDLFNKSVALVSLILSAFSLVLINFSRFSWNPNLLPLSSLLFFYMLIKGFQKGKNIYFLLAGVFFGICIQFHYVALALLLPAFIVVAEYIYKNRSQIILALKNILLLIIGTIIVSFPLIIFDLRHNFLNSRNFIKLFSDQGASADKGLLEILNTFNEFNKIVFNVTINQTVSALILLALVILTVYFYRKNIHLKYILIFFIGALLLTSFYTGRKIPHYFGALYPFYFILLAYLLHYLMNRKFFLILLIFFSFYITFQSKGYYFLTNQGNFQIEKSQNIAKKILDNVNSPTNKFQVTGLPDKYSDSTHRYFLELWGKRPLAKDSLDKAEELFVICESECSPIGDPQWDIAYFAPRKITQEWKIDERYIYKLER